MHSRLKIHFLTLAAILMMPALFSCSGCSDKGDSRTGDNDPRFRSVDTPRFAKIDSMLTLHIGSKTLLYHPDVQVQPKLGVQVWNKNLSSMEISEWQKNESDNIRLSIAPCKMGKSGEIPPNAWKQVWPTEKPEPGKTVHRLPVSLSPGNFLTVPVPMDFVAGYKLTVPEQWIALKVELNLHSVKAEPVIREILLRNKKRAKVCEVIVTD